jgi:hypothetical protein
VSSEISTTEVGVTSSFEPHPAAESRTNKAGITKRIAFIDGKPSYFAALGRIAVVFLRNRRIAVRRPTSNEIHSALPARQAQVGVTLK